MEQYLTGKWVGGRVSNLLPTTTALTVTASATLDLGGVNQQVASLAGGGTITNSESGTLTVLSIAATAATSSRFSGTIQDGLATGGGTTALLVGNDATLVLSGTNTYTGGTTVTAGTLIVNNATALPDGTSLTVGAGGTLIFDPTAAGSPVVAVAGSQIVARAGAGNAGPVDRGAGGGMRRLVEETD